MSTSQTAWHALEAEAVTERLESATEGLSAENAAQRLKTVGPNTLEAEESVNPAKLLIRQVHNPLIYLLIGAAVLSLAAGKFIDAGVIVGVIVFNSLLGFFQEWRAEGALAALRRMASLHAKVLRDGNPIEVEASDVVPGDVLLLETGDRVSADARLLAAEELQVDESALTGESQPVAKRSETLDEGTAMADRRNMVWMSTNVTGGRGRAVVVHTGMQTQMGQIAGAVRSTLREQTPLQKRMHTLGIVLGAAGIGLALVVLALEIVRAYEVTEAIMFAVAIAVSAIPEGLPAVISVTLAMGVRRMADRHAIIRHMPAVETLGSTTVICTDKTGTLTKNQMTVRKMWADGRTFELTGEGYEPKGQLKDQAGKTIEHMPKALEVLLQTGVLNNNARIHEQDGRWQADGNPSEAALLTAAQKTRIDLQALQKDSPRLSEIPFSSERKYMATLHSQEGRGTRAYVKGGADRLLEFCTYVLKDGNGVVMDDKQKQTVAQAIEDFADDALRVMAAAYVDFEEDKQTLAPEDVEGGLMLAGLWAMIDPPREESVQAVRQAKEAGIHPVMITGDHAATALAIAKQVGIAGDGQALTGPEIDTLDKPALAAAALRSGVFARVSPAHKLKIMEALREKGHVVAMTGDGVNDAPALKGADIGIAMGQSGTEVAKEASDMILTDDNFATIVHAIEEGRVIFSNLRRVVYFLVATNIGEILTMVAALLIGLDLPLTAVMILWINLVTDGACTIPLGVEPKHWDVLKLPPRDPRQSILTGDLIRRIVLLTPLMAAGTLLMYHGARPGGLEYARTVAFTTLAAFQWFQAFNARSHYQSIFSIGIFSNKWLLTGVAAAILMQVAVVHTAVGRTLFGTTSLSAADWLRIVLMAGTIWVVEELLKRLGVHGRAPKHE
ncbi:MAG: HAD-IC family P-type ATPase [Phycisphaerae bacterium]|nr:HAD-IC family P-type ATPase [Phycisphaerae bacterium]